MLLNTDGLYATEEMVRWLIVQERFKSLTGAVIQTDNNTSTLLTKGRPLCSYNI